MKILFGAELSDYCQKWQKRWTTMAVVQYPSPEQFPAAELSRSNSEDGIIERIAHELATFYIPYRLRTKLDQLQLRGLPRSYLIPPAKPAKLHSLLGKLCIQMEENNTTFFSGIAQRLEVGPGNARTIFMDVASKIFSEDINWGRIVSLYTFAGVLAHYFMSEDRPEIVCEIVDWLGRFVENNLTEWIKNRGGWDDFEKCMSNEETQRFWPKVIAYGSVCAAAGFMLLSGLHK